MYLQLGGQRHVVAHFGVRSSHAPYRLEDGVSRSRASHSHSHRIPTVPPRGLASRTLLHFYLAGSQHEKALGPSRRTIHR